MSHLGLFLLFCPIFGQNSLSLLLFSKCHFSRSFQFCYHSICKQLLPLVLLSSFSIDESNHFIHSLLGLIDIVNVKCLCVLNSFYVSYKLVSTRRRMVDISVPTTNLILFDFIYLLKKYRHKTLLTNLFNYSWTNKNINFIRWSSYEASAPVGWP